MRELSELLGNPKNQDAWDRKLANYRVVGSINRLVDARGISKTDLANSIGVSLSEISQVLSGERNLTINTINKILSIIDGELLVVANEEANQRRKLRISNCTEGDFSSQGNCIPITYTGNTSKRSSDITSYYNQIYR